MTRNEAVWITGVGGITSVGTTYREIADQFLSGRTGIQKITNFPVDDHPCQIGAQVLEVPCPSTIEESEFQTLSRLERCALWCTATALEHAGLSDRSPDLRVGIVLGLGAEWMQVWQDDWMQGGQRIFFPRENSDSIVDRVRRRLHLTGPSMNVAIACASGNLAMSQAREWLRRGWVDVCLAGGCDVGIGEASLASFGNMRTLSRRNAAPQLASRPFDKNRDGFVIGEGGSVCVLERASDARARQATGYAEVAGYGASSDAYHLVIPSPDPVPGILAMQNALQDAGCEAKDIDYINAHATSTPVGDIAEARVLQAVLGPAIDEIPVSSTKGITGHLLSAASAVETIACVAALNEQRVPPTINLEEPDPECPLRHVPNQAQAHRVNVTASNSFGFGGNNTCLILRSVA